MSKNIEIVAEIINDSVIKLEKSTIELQKFETRFSNTVQQASLIEIKTKRLEEVITHWNLLFDSQKAQILQLQKKKNSNILAYRIVIFGLLAIIILLILKSK